MEKYSLNERGVQKPHTWLVSGSKYNGRRHNKVTFLMLLTLKNR